MRNTDLYEDVGNPEKDYLGIIQGICRGYAKDYTSVGRMIVIPHNSPIPAPKAIVSNSPSMFFST